MSFSRARIRRFNDETGNTPAPGSYDPKFDTKIIGTGAVIEKCERFAAPKSISGQGLPPASLNTSFNAGRKSSSLSNLPVFRTPKIPQKTKPVTSAKGKGKGKGKVASLESQLEAKDLQDIEGLLIQKDLKIRDLEADIEILKSEYDENEQKKSSALLEMTMKLDSYQGIIDERDNQLTSQQALLLEKISEIDQLKTELSEKNVLADKLRQLTLSNKTLKAQHSELLKVKDALEEKNDDLVKDIFKLQGIEKELRVLLLEAGDNISESILAVKNLEDKMEFLQVENFAEKVLLEDKIEDLKSQCDEAKKNLAEKEETVTFLQTSVDALEAAVSDFKGKDVIAAECKEEFERKIAQKQEMILLLQGELSEKELEHEELSSEHAKLLEQLERKQARLQELDAEVVNLCSKIDDLTNTLNMMEENVMNASVVKGNMESTISCQQTAYETLQVDYDALRIDLEGKLVNQIMESSRKFGELNFELLETRGKLQFIENDCLSLNQTRLDLEARLVGAMQEIESLALAREELRVINLEYQLTIADLHDKADSLVVEINANSTYWAQQVDKSRMEVNALRRQCKVFEIGSGNLLDTLRAVSDRLVESSRDSDAQNELIAKLHETNSLLEKKTMDQADELEAQKLSMIVMEAESIREIEEVRTSLLNKLEQLRQHYVVENKKLLEEFKDEIVILQLQISDMAVNIEVEEYRYNELSKYHATLQHNFTLNGAELQSTKFDLLCLQDVLKEKEEKIRVMENDIAIIFQNCEQSSLLHKTQIDEMHSSLKKSSEDAAKAHLAVASKIDEANARNETLTAELDHVTAKYHKATKEMEELFSMISSERIEREQEKNKFVATIKQKDECLVSQTEREEQWSLLSAENIAKEAQVQEMRSAIQRTSEQLDALFAEKLSKDKQITELKDALELSKKEVKSWESEDWKQKYMDMASLVGPFRQQLEDFEAERKGLESRKEAADNQVKDLSMKYAQVLGHQNIKQKIHHVVQLKEHNLELKQTVEKLEGEIRSRDKSLKKLKSDLATLSQKKGLPTNQPRRPMTPLALSDNTKSNHSPGRQSPSVKSVLNA